MTALTDDVKWAAEWLGKAAELLREAAKATSPPSEVDRRSVGEEIVGMQLKVDVDEARPHDTARCSESQEAAGAEKKAEE